MLQVDYKDKRPLYEQIREKMKLLIVKGILKPDEKIPSVRELAQSLTINPNTIQKAYRELEDKGYIYSVGGRGSFVSPVGRWMDDKKQEELFQSLERTIAEMIYHGVEFEKVISTVNRVYQRERGGKTE